MFSFHNSVLGSSFFRLSTKVALFIPMKLLGGPLTTFSMSFSLTLLSPQIEMSRFYDVLTQLLCESTKCFGFHHFSENNLSLRIFKIGQNDHFGHQIANMNLI